MPYTWRRFLSGLFLFLGAGALTGWFYGRADLGLLVAALLALGWQVRHLLKFEQALRTQDFAYLRFGEGIWSQLFSRFSHLRQRNRKHKHRYQYLLKEVREMTNALPDGGVVLNSADEIELCNPAAQELAGFDSRQDRGQRVDNILRDPEFVRYLRSRDYAAAVEFPSPVRDGVWLYCRIVPYGGSQKLLLLRDITERRRLTAMRREFVANASHELRSPLTVISGYLDALAEDPEAPAAWQKPLGQMRGQALRMNRIVADLLDLSRLEAGTSAGTEQEIDVASLLHAAAEPYAGDAAKPAVEVQVKSLAKIRGSASEVESLVRNLLSNAVRHTAMEGSIQLIWRSAPAGAELVVSDNGEGIAEEHIPRITERFFRVDGGRSRGNGGVGLGLAIVKHVLERHHAELEIRSRIGAGSSFICRFPAERIVEPRPAPLAQNP